jgi:hypothetical protein
MKTGHIVLASVLQPDMNQAIAAPNSSGALNATLLSWAEIHGNMQGKVLLVTEPVPVRTFLSTRYPLASFVCVGLVDESQLGGFDFEVDLCQRRSLPRKTFDVAFFQAALEHMIDPVTVMNEICGSLKPGPKSVLVMHTHTPRYPYHGAPRDYLRFMPDWFEDLPGILDVRVTLVELWCNEEHLLACYRREQ